MRNVNPYSVLAAGYDFVMAHVDYVSWAAYIDELIQRYDTSGRSPIELVELGCGTASFGFELGHIGGYRYRGLDASQEMINVARHKAEAWGQSINVGVAKFLSFNEREQNDVALLLYDGLNYILGLRDVGTVLDNVYRSLRPGGLFLFDQSTPSNSENNRQYFEDRGEHEDFSYVRQSAYDSETSMHRTRFEFAVGKDRFVEEHVQRAYSIAEIDDVVAGSAFEKVACFEGFSTVNASEAAERVQWILRRPMY